MIPHIASAVSTSPPLLPGVGDAADGGEVDPMPGRLSILVAHGNRIGRSLLVRLLESRGHRVEPLATSEAARQALAEGLFDLAFLQMDLPGHEGALSAGSYRSIAAGRSVTLIGIAPEANDENRRICGSLGMEACMGIPIDAQALFDVVEACVRDREAKALGDRRGAEVLRAAPAGAASGPREGTEASGRPVINAQALDDLEKLGGREFVDDVVRQFVGDAGRLQIILADAVAAVDVKEFQDQLHALRSCAANVGADAIYKMCLAWREIESDELTARGPEHLISLDSEIEAARASLIRYLARSSRPPSALA